MPGEPPPPLVQAFVVCREIHVDRQSGDLTLVAPFSGLTPPRYPVPQQLSVYAHLTEARGRYAMRLHLEDDDGQVVWAWDIPCPVEEADPLRSHRIALHDIVVPFPRPGRYSLVMSANGDELAHHVLLARSTAPAAAGSGAPADRPRE